MMHLPNLYQCYCKDSYHCVLYHVWLFKHCAHYVCNPGPAYYVALIPAIAHAFDHLSLLNSVR